MHPRTPDNDERGWVKAVNLLKTDMVMVDTTTKWQKKFKGKREKNKKKSQYKRLRVGEFHPFKREKESYYKNSIYDSVVVDTHRLVYEAHLNGMPIKEFISATHFKNSLKFINPKTHHVHHLNHDSKDNRLENLQLLEAKEHLKIHGNSDYFGHGKPGWSKVVSVKPHGVMMTYDICCEAPYHNFSANNIIVHNSGKTAPSVHFMKTMMNKHKQVLPTLILCPPVVIDNWVKEIQMHSKIDEKYIHCLTGPGKDRLKIMKSETGIFITNYEALLMADVFAEMVKLLAKENSIFICDEIHRCKDMGAKRTKKAISLSDLAQYRLGLTGTPVLNNPMDLFSQCRIIDRGHHFGSNFYAFRAKYFYDKNRAMPRDRYFPDWKLLPNSIEEIKEILSKFTMAVKKKDCIDLPPLVKKRITVELSPEQRRLYDSMKEDLIATLTTDDGHVHASIAELAITKALRLQQIVSGILRVEGDDGVSTLRIQDNPRKAALKELLSDIAPFHKVLVWSVFKDNYEDIRSVCESLSLPYVEVHGGIKDKQDAVKRFIEDDSIRVYIGHPMSGGIGLNLVEASYSIYYTRNFSLEQRLQSEARNYRGGSMIHEKITQIDIVAPGTIDELVLRALEDKTELSCKILKERVKDI